MLLGALKTAGTLETTNIIITSDHGHSDIAQTFAPNVLLAKADLLRLDMDGAVASWDAWVHPAGLTGQVHIRLGAGPEVAERTWSVLQSWAADPAVPIAAVRSAKSVRNDHGFAGPFAAVLEGGRSLL